jgi:hypothetical protein
VWCVDLPVNADFEGGFAHEADKVRSSVARAVKTGIAGLSIEDSTGDPATPLYERVLLKCGKSEHPTCHDKPSPHPWSGVAIMPAMP